MAEIFEHNKSEDTYDDPDHPIPALRYIDINSVKKDGGSDLVIIIASPLKSDPYSNIQQSHILQEKHYKNGVCEC